MSELDLCVNVARRGQEHQGIAALRIIAARQLRQAEGRQQDRSGLEIPGQILRTPRGQGQDGHGQDRQVRGEGRGPAQDPESFTAVQEQRGAVGQDEEGAEAGDGAGLGHDGQPRRQGRQHHDPGHPAQAVAHGDAHEQEGARQQQRRGQPGGHGLEPDGGLEQEGEGDDRGREDLEGRPGTLPLQARSVGEERP